MDLRDLERLTRELSLRKRLQEALLLFSRSTAARGNLPSALESLAADVTALFGTRRAEIWLYDRRATVLNLAGSSDPRDSASPTTVQADEDAPLTRALRRDTPELVGAGSGLSLTVPMRGWRRALGTLVLEGEPSNLTHEQYVDLAGDLGRQLSALVENLLAVEDATRRHGDVAQVRAQLAQVQKLAFLGQFAASLAHEINNPLQGVLGHLELLLGRLPPEDAGRLALQRVYNDADRAARIAHHLLVFAGSRRTPKRPIEVARLLADAIAIHEGVAHRAQVEFAQDPAVTLPSVLGDGTLLQQAILNILLNAEQAIAGAGAPGTVFLSAHTVDGGVTIEIEDTGPGIAPDAVPHIFDPFFTTKEPGKGTGLGLAITAGIIEEHGGTLTARRSRRGGALFSIYLPAAGGRVGAQAPVHD